MKTREAPTLRELDENDINSILARNNVGRLVFATDDDVDVRPLHYVYSNGGIYGRTSPRSKIADTEEAPPHVAFEVDEVESIFRWKSVIVKGDYAVLSPEAEEWRKASELMRRVVKDAFTPNDPLQERSVLFRLSLDRVTGRASD